MATRPLTNAEALPALETFELDLLEQRSRSRRAQPCLGTGRAAARRASCWSRRALRRSSAPATPGSCGSRPLARGLRGASCSACSTCAAMYGWRLRVSVLDDLRSVVAATALGVDGAPQPPRSSFPATWTTSRRRRCACSPSARSTWPPAAWPRLGRSSRPAAGGELAQADADRRRRPRRPADREPAARAPGARPRAGRLPRQGAARRGTTCRCPCSARAGISSG